LGLSATIFKGEHPRIIPTRFGVIWFSGFRGEDLNVNVYDGRMADTVELKVMAKAHMAFV
jgi:hypothetical protein